MTALGAEDLDLVRRRVINVVGHELRTPLTTIRGLADLLPDASDEELRETLIPALVRNARRAERLLDDLLIAGEVDTAFPTEPAQHVDLGAIVAEMAADTALEIEDGPDGLVLGHPDAIAHAVRHLVDNADQYADGTPSLRYEHDESSIILVITTPIDREVPDLALGFELFFRGESAVTRAAGLGVGLPIARALARMDGGDVTIDQVSDTDAVITRLTLPRAR